MPHPLADLQRLIKKNRGRWPLAFAEVRPQVKRAY